MFPNASVTEDDVVSFNIKGPKRFETMRRLISEKDQAKMDKLEQFNFCELTTVSGDKVYVARTIIGMEMWGSSDALTSSWRNLLTHSDIVIPCAWDLLETFRMECEDICFALHPLDMNYSTTLWDVGLGWMIPKEKTENYIGKEALENSKGEVQYKLIKLYSSPDRKEAPQIGERIIDKSGINSGYVTSSGYSYLHNQYIAFVHIAVEVEDDVRLYSPNGTYWQNAPISTENEKSFSSSDENINSRGNWIHYQSIH